jgi:putative protease
MEEKEIGKVTHYFGKLGVCVIQLSDTVKNGDKIHIKGATTDFEQHIDSIQINHKDVAEAKKGQGIGLQVREPVREHDIVYKVID